MTLLVGSFARWFVGSFPECTIAARSDQGHDQDDDGQENGDEGFGVAGKIEFEHRACHQPAGACAGAGRPFTRVRRHLPGEGLVSYFTAAAR